MTTYEILDNDGSVIADGYNAEKVKFDATCFLSDLRDGACDYTEVYKMRVTDDKDAETTQEVILHIVVEVDDYDGGEFDFLASRGC